MTTPEQWREAKQIVAQALELDASSRPAFLERACNDAGVRGLVESLLAFDQDELGEPGLWPAAGGERRAGEMVGPYRLVEEIGRGGMGVVYRAERADQLYEKQVAVKLLQSALRPAELVRRFEQERRILARLDHPAIARMLDAGLLNGQPYFVMELVEGVPLTDFAQGQQLSQRQRLNLFLKVCEGVSAAHRQLVVHLDLKPGNILVTLAGEPKLLDFGIAHALEDDGALVAPLEEPVRLSPGYASPEQKAGGAVTVASDIFSLGVVLQELLAAGDAGTRALAPSPDLQAVLERAQAVDPAHRYRTVDQLAEDLRNYSGGYPVLARPAGWRYRAWCFWGRHRWAVSGSVLAAVALVAALGLALYQGQVAQRRFHQVHQLAGTLMFEFHDAVRDLPGALPARELVVKHALEYLDRLTQEASGDVALKKDLAESYLRVGDVQGLYYERNLGRRQEAAASYGKALQLFEQVQAARPFSPSARADLAEAHIRVAAALNTMDQPAEALEHHGQAERIASGGWLSIPPLVIARAKANFGRAETLESMGRLNDALEARRATLKIIEELDRQRPGDRRILRYLAMAHKRYGASLIKDGQHLDQARVELDAALATDLKIQAPHDATSRADIALDHYYLGVLAFKSGQRASARAELEQARQQYQSLIAADAKDVRSNFFLEATERQLGELERGDGSSSTSGGPRPPKK